MKKLLFIVCILLIGGCTLEYKEIVPYKPIEGTTITIDSTQWRQVMIKEESGQLHVYEEGQIKRVELIDSFIYLYAAMVTIVAFFCMILFLSK